MARAALDTVIINGSVLASLLFDVAMTTSDSDGLLFGAPCFDTKTVVNDSDGMLRRFVD